MVKVKLIKAYSQDELGEKVDEFIRDKLLIEIKTTVLSNKKVYFATITYQEV